jgi:P-type Cu2+ transporter
MIGFVNHEPAASIAVCCAHCGLPATAAEAATRHDDARVFCCDACATAWTILQARGLDAYHRFPERRNTPVQRSGRRFAEFDHERFQSRYVTHNARGQAQTTLALEGVHCASCVWLVERVPLLLDGVISAELNVRQSRADVVWDPAQTSLSAIAQMLDTLGYTPHPYRGADRRALRQREERAMLVRIGIAGAIATNVMLAAIALYAGEFNPMDGATLALFRWISLALTLVSIAFPGRVFFTSALAGLRTRTVHMDVPIALALGAGTIRGAINTVHGTGPIYFDGVCLLILLLLTGRYLQARGQRAATDATEQLFALTPATARVVLADASVSDVPADSLAVGDTVLVHPGETVPADGTVLAGRSHVNRAILSGEATEVHVREGDRVFAGTLNTSSPLRIIVEASGDETRIARIMAQIDESNRRRAPIVLLADRIAAWVVGVVLVLAAITFALWYRRDATAAWDHTIALLIVTCPCALAMATPLAMTAAVGRAARGGIFIKGGDTLEALTRPGVLVLDKTGTLTTGVTSLVSWTGDASVQPLVLALEATSTHPIAAGFRRAWPTVRSGATADVSHTIGGGMIGTVNGHTVAVGSPAFVSQHAQGPADTWSRGTPTGNTLVHVAVDGRVVAAATFADAIRPDTAAALAELRTRGWRTVLLSGDNAGASQRVGRALGFAEADIIADATPEGKAERVRALVDAQRTQRGGSVVMVGDGVNDAVAIAAATVGIGVHGGAEASLATADVALTTPGLRPLVALETGARRALRVIRMNIGWAFAYNTVGVALAMSGVITPLIAAIMMPASSLTVVLCSWLGRTFTSEPS